MVNSRRMPRKRAPAVEQVVEKLGDTMDPENAASMVDAALEDLHADAQLHVKDLVTDPNQTRRHTQRNLGMIGDALQEVGAGRSIVIDESNVILAGNGTVEAAAERGITRVRVIEADGNEIIAVRRSNLTPEQKVKLALFDNRAAELAEYDLSALIRVTDEFGLERSEWFTSAELRALEDREVAHDLTGATQAAPKADTVPSIPEGYTAFSLVLSHEAADEIRKALDDVKTRTGLKTLAEALLVIVRAYDATRENSEA